MTIRMHNGYWTIFYTTHRGRATHISCASWADAWAAVFAVREAQAAQELLDSVIKAEAQA